MFGIEDHGPVCCEYNIKMLEDMESISYFGFLNAILVGRYFLTAKGRHHESLTP